MSAKRYVKFNVNNFVRVQLTEHGLKVHRAAYDVLFSHLPPHAREHFPYLPPDTDKDGWSRFQMWDVLKTFGPHVWMTGKPCFWMDIEFEVETP